VEITPKAAMYRSNNQGTYYFMSLMNRKRLHSKRWNKRPMTEKAIKQVEI